MPVILKTSILLLLSNIFMTFAWYAHLRNLNNRAWYIAAFASWGIALLEYMLQVPANRIGYTELNLPPVKDTPGSDNIISFHPFRNILYGPACEA